MTPDPAVDAPSWASTWARVGQGRARRTQRRAVGQAEAAYAVRTPHPAGPRAFRRTGGGATVARSASAVAQARTPSGGIGLSGQMHGVVPTEADGTPVAPRHAVGRLARRRSSSTSTGACPRDPRAGWPTRSARGWRDRSSRGSPQRAATDRPTRWALQPKDWLRLQLTGEVAHGAERRVGDPDVRRRWATPGPTASSRPSASTRACCRPCCRRPAAAGALTAAAAPSSSGLPAGIPVAAGAGGHRRGRPRLRPGRPRARPADDRHGRPGRHARRTGPAGPAPRPRHALLPRRDRPGHYRMAAVLNGGLALRWVCDILGASWRELYATAAQTPGRTTRCSCRTSAASARRTWTPRCAAPGRAWPRGTPGATCCAPRSRGSPSPRGGGRLPCSPRSRRGPPAAGRGRNGRSRVAPDARRRPRRRVGRSPSRRLGTRRGAPGGPGGRADRTSPGLAALATRRSPRWCAPTPDAARATATGGQVPRDGRAPRGPRARPRCPVLG